MNNEENELTEEKKAYGKEKEIDARWRVIPGGITAPNGFQAAGICAGLKNSKKKDLALLLAPEGAICSGNFTSSLARAGCIELCKETIEQKAGQIRGVIINSGHANACTGERGIKDTLFCTQEVQSLLNLSEKEILMNSTGVIGKTIPIEKIKSNLKELISNLSEDGGGDAAQAILTTDLKTKEIAIETNFGEENIRIGGMAKGSGMIEPDMATMLGYISCNVKVDFKTWQEIVSKAVDKSFNMITVDGDTSTNDCVLAFSYGRELDEKYLAKLQEGVDFICKYLARSITRDGEGATCLFSVRVSGTKDNDSARKIVKEICKSSLVKTAIHGCDPNWGRVIAAIGRSGVEINLDELEIRIGDVFLVKNGVEVEYREEEVSHYMKEKQRGEYLIEDEIEIEIEVGKEAGTSIGWGCDLSAEYVKINSEYTT